MPTIEMSQAFGANISARMIRLGDNTNTQNVAAQAGLLNQSSSFGSNLSLGWLFLMRGTPPVGFLANYNARASDILCQYSALGFTGANFQTTNQNTNPAVISTEYVTASQTGVCTWFWLTVLPMNFSSTIITTGTPLHQIIGTVGTPGSGSDLEIPNVNITAGEQYRVLNLRLQFPTSWNY